MQNGDKALPSISRIGRGQSVQMLITLKPHGLFQDCLATGMQKGDKASPSISPNSRGHLVKMLITLEPKGIF